MSVTNRCRKCVLPAQVPGSQIERGVCAFCRSPPPRSNEEDIRRGHEADLEETLRSCRGNGAYDAVVCVSGGKDSLYLLHRIVVEYGLRVLAVTMELDLPDVAVRSIERTIRTLDVDHLVVRPRPAFVEKLFRYLLTHQEPRGAVYTLSYVYAPLFEGEAIRVAADRGIPLVLAGYSPGQPEPSRMVYEFTRDLVAFSDWTPPGLLHSGAFSREELACFWNPRGYPRQALPRYLAPFHAWRYDQAEVMREVVRLGLVQRKAHANPIASNYPINWLMMFSDLKNFGYNPYAPEFSALIRAGKAPRNYWRLMGPVVDAMIRHRVLYGREVTRSLAWLELAPEDLRITEPLHAYDPVVGALGIAPNECVEDGTSATVHGAPASHKSLNVPQED